MRRRALDIALVFCGGSAGTAVRYALTLALPVAAGLPIIFAINVSGAFLLGMLSARVARAGSSVVAARAWLLVGTGALGGYTTYGTFVADADGLLDASRFAEGIVYGLVTVVVGVGAALAGSLVAGRRSANPDRMNR